MQAAQPPTLPVAMVAGEASGDLLAGLLLQGMRQRWPGLQAQGIGGPQMAQQGFEAWWPHHKLAVHGFSWELIRRYREIVGIREQLAQRLEREPPRLFVGVDAPDFNLGLEQRLRARGVKTVHFVCPSIWAWRAHRVNQLRASCDHVLCLFPFEPALLAEHGVPATYVGHPLAPHIPMEPDQGAVRRTLGLEPDDTVVAVLPGSRESEIRHLCPRFFAAVARIRHAFPATKFIVPVVPGLHTQVQALLDASGQSAHVQLLQGQSHTALAACDVTLIASGTATLEAALFKRPMVIAYHMAWWSWMLMNRKRLQPWVGLPNILCRDFVVPELLQDAATPDALAQGVLQWLQDLRTGAPRVQAVRERFTHLHHSLLRNTPQLAADAIEKVLHP
ncbi:MAG: lipid-A-disaccharide synthase [Rhodoferax sp.]